MSISYGSHTTYTGNAGGGASFTGPTITGTDTYLLVGITVNGSNEPAPTSVTYDGVAMTSLGSVRGGGYNRVNVYGTVNPGSAKTVSYAGDFGTSIALAVYYTGVHQTTPTRTATTGGGASTPASIDVTNSAVNDLIIGFFGTNDTPLTNSFTVARIGAGQTFREAIENASEEALISFCEEAGASGTVTNSWAYNGVYAWSAVAIPLIPSGVSAATALPRRAIDGPFYGSLRGSAG